MQFTSAQFDTIVRALGITAFTVHDAARVVALSRLAIASDDREDIDESDLLDTLTGYVSRLAGSPGATLDEVDDGRGDMPERLARLGAGLDGGTAGLAYLMAYLLTIADLNIDPEEEAFLGQLRTALQITDARAGELVAVVNTALSAGG